MRWLKVSIGLLVAVSIGWSGTQSEEKVGNLTFKMPPGWTKKLYRNEIELKPGDVKPSEWCTVTIKASLQANGDLVQWLNKQADEFLRGREVLMNTPIPYQDDPKGWEGCGLSFAVRVNANTPTYYHMLISFRRGDIAGTMHFVTDRLDYTQKYQEAIGVISGSLKPSGGFGASGNVGNPPLANPTTKPGTAGTPPPTNPSGPGGNAGSSTVSSPSLYLPDSLPPPAPVPDGTADAAAKSLARRILNGGSDGLAALERAVLMCGFSIHEMPGKKSVAVANSPNGMSFADIDLIGANALMECGTTYDLGSLQAAFRGVKSFSQLEFVPLWKKSIDAASASSRSTDKFYGSLIKALGTESQGRFTDFNVASATATICPAQMYLLVWRSVGHLVAAKKEDTPVRHGPSTSAQGSQADAISDLTTAVDSFSNVDWTNVLSELVSRPDSQGIHDYLLAIARLQIMLAGIEWWVGLDEPRPLIRSKSFGESGEDRELLVGVKMTLKKTKRAWEKYIAAVKSLGYSLSETNGGEFFDVHWAGSGNKTIEPDREKSIEVTNGNGGEKIYSIPIQGSPQQRKLSANPEPEQKKGRADIEIRLIPGALPGNVVKAEHDVLTQVALESIWMKASRDISYDVPVRDWKSSGWGGTLAIGVTGSGGFSRGNSSVRWEVNRSYIMDVTLDHRAQNMLVTRRPLPEGGYSLLPGSPIQGTGRINDSYFFKGPIKNCVGETLGSGSITTTWQSRPPGSRLEEVKLQQTPILEFDPSKKTFSILFSNGSPYIPAIQKTVTVINGKSKPSSEIVREALFFGVKAPNDDYRKAAAVLDQSMPDENRLHDQKDTSYAFVGPETNMQGEVKISLLWNISEGGEEEEALESIANRGLVYLVMQELTRSALKQALPMDEEPSVEDEDMATCVETKAQIQGQLRHAIDRSRPARCRSSR